MKHSWMAAAGASIDCGLSGRQRARAAQEIGGQERVHTAVSFAFDAHASLDDVMPLFGADRERGWAEGWEPEFIYPLPAADLSGMVFRVLHDGVESTWINTQFDLARGAVQYAYVVPNVMTCLIAIRATGNGMTTHVEVTYERTALNAAANAHVEKMAAADRNAGPEWARQINAYLAKGSGPSHPPKLR